MRNHRKGLMAITSRRRRIMSEEHAYRSFGNWAEAAELYIDHRLSNLVGRVHDERTVLHDRLVDGLARKHDDVTVFFGDELGPSWASSRSMD